MRRGLLKEFDKLVSYALPLMDALAALSATIVAYVVLIGLERPVPLQYRLFLVAFPLVVPSWLAYFGVYQAWRGRSVVAEIRRVGLALLLLFGLFAVLTLLTKTGALYSRLWIGWSFVGCLLALLGFRLILRTLLAALRKRGFNTKHIILLGAGSSLKRVAQRLEAYSGAGIKAVAAIEFEDLQDVAITGSLTDLLEEVDVDQIWVSTALKDISWLQSLRAVVAPYSVSVFWVPDLEGLDIVSRKIHQVAGMSVVSLQGDPLAGRRAYLKAFEDKIVAALVVLCLLPVYAVIALAITLDSPGPVVFRQKRHGWNGRDIEVYKFRTMYDRPERGQIESAKLNDARVTRVGRWLRKFSLDELPQFVNVLQGRMSIVGPRPHSVTQKDLFKSFAAQYPRRQKVKPGITGWAQINGLRGEVTSPEVLQKRVEYDLFYIENWSLWFDIKIIFLTALKGWVGPKAY